MSEANHKRELSVIEVLDYLDGPTLFIAEDAAESRYICTFLKNTETHTEFLCTLVGRGRLNSFLAGNMDLKEAIFSAPLKQYFLLRTTSSEEEPLSAEQVNLEELDQSLLPADGYSMPLFVEATEDHLMRRALLDASLDIPGKTDSHVLPAYTLAGFLNAVQDFVKFCYKKEIAGIRDPEKRKSLSDPIYSTNEVYATAPGSFKVKMRSATVAENALFPYVPMELAFDKAEEILSTTSDVEGLLVALRTNKGHLVGAYRRLLDFLVEHKATLDIKWVKASDLSRPKKFIITLDDAIKIQSALGTEMELDDEFLSFVGTVPHANVEKGSWTMIISDGQRVHGELQEGKNVTLAGITLETVRYEFKCKEEITTDALGKERHRLLLYDYSEAVHISI